MPADSGESEPLLADIEGLNNHPDDPLESSSPNRSSLEILENSSSSPDSSRNKRVAGLLSKIPAPLRKCGERAYKWALGPEDPQPHRITPIFPGIQELPVHLLHRLLSNRKHRIWLYVLYLGLWFMTFVLLFRKSTFAAEIDGWGVPTNIGCGEAYWLRGNGCGLDGNECRPFNGSGFAFRCPASCGAYQVANPRAVGDQEIIYAPVVVGGPVNEGDINPIYRGDSMVCVAAIHSGFISDELGGCGVVQLVGQSQDYVGSNRHGVQSVSFDSYFPLSFTFAGDVQCQARDLRWEMLAADLTFMVVLSLFLTSPHVFFFTVMPAVFWHVGMASDPPPVRPVAHLIEVLVGRFLPAMFVAWVMFDKMGIRRTLSGLTAHVEKVVLWLGSCWVGALENYTFDMIPINRLTPHDLKQQPGAKASLVVIVIIGSCLTLVQAWYFRAEGRFIKYINFYLSIGFVLLIFCLIPQLALRIHHYFLALLLLPGTSMQTRLSLVLQGLMVGLFINGVARWGFDPILQTAQSLQGDAVHNSPLPVILEPNITLADTLNTIMFNWMPPPGPRYQGISILVNDVERYRTYFADQWPSNFTWTRDSNMHLPEYFRFGYVEGTETWDYTKAGKWDADGNWIKMDEGPSRVKRGVAAWELEQRTNRLSVQWKS